MLDLKTYLLERTDQGENAFLAAIRARRSLDFIRELDDFYCKYHGSDGSHRRNPTSGNQQSALHWAVAVGHVTAVDWLLMKDPQLRNLQNSFTEEPYQVARNKMQSAGAIVWPS